MKFGENYRKWKIVQKTDYPPKLPEARGFSRYHIVITGLFNNRAIFGRVPHRCAPEGPAPAPGRDGGEWR
jgi:hypothetical protein